jgi:hypothetical protein
MDQPATLRKDGRMAQDQETAAESAFRSRPTWWLEGNARDVADAAGDQRADERDTAASRRDRAAQDRDQAGLGREQDAADFAVQAHGRYDAHADTRVEPLINAERLCADKAAYGRISETLRSQPDLAAAFDRAREHMDELYVALLRSGIVTDHARSELQTLAQLLAAAAADRRAAEQDRGYALTDRADAKRDRDNARSGRQQAAMDRARDPNHQ